MTISDAIKNFFRDNERYTKLMLEEKTSFFIKLLIFSFVIKNFFFILSPHTFPEELSFENVGITSPTIAEYLFSSIISLYISFLVSLPILAFNIKHRLSLFITFLTNIIFGLVISLPFLYNSKSLNYLSFILIPVVFLILSIKITKEDYLYLLKTSISLNIISAVFAPFIYLSEITNSEIIYLMINLIASFVYFIYYIKMIKARFDLSIARIILYSIFPLLTYIAVALILTKTEIFSPNIVKMLLYH